MTEQNGTPTAPRNPDSIITTQRNGQTIVAELFFNHSSTETFRDKLLKTILADSSRLSASDGQEPEKFGNLAITAAPTIHSPSGRFLSSKRRFLQVKSRRKAPEKLPLLRDRGAERSLHENRAYQTGKDHRYLV